MEIVINYWAVLACGVTSIVLGTLWYGPFFGKKWMKLSGITMGKMDATAKRKMMTSYGIMTAGSLVMAYVLAHSLIFAAAYTSTAGIAAGLMVGFWTWVGFIAPTSMGATLWEGKSWTLWMINSGYYLALLLTMGIILALWK